MNTANQIANAIELLSILSLVKESLPQQADEIELLVKALEKGEFTPQNIKLAEEFIESSKTVLSSQVALAQESMTSKQQELENLAASLENIANEARQNESELQDVLVNLDHNIQLKKKI